MNLTSKQHEIVRFIWDFRRTRGIAPTLSEIAEQMGVSKITVHEHIALLEKKGAIKKEKYQSRSLKLARRIVKELEALTAARPKHHDARAAKPSLVVPLLGRIAAGRPIEAIEDRQELDLAEVVRFERASFALRVRGDSMIDEGIRDGDIVLVDARPDAREGETVVAVIDREEATLKKFHRAGDRVRLVPANATMQPIEVPAEKLEIRGVVVGVVRRY